jgi:hypothetical protein
MACGLWILISPVKQIFRCCAIRECPFTKEMMKGMFFQASVHSDTSQGLISAMHLEHAKQDIFPRCKMEFGRTILLQREAKDTKQFWENLNFRPRSLCFMGQYLSPYLLWHLSLIPSIFFLSLCLDEKVT